MVSRLRLIGQLPLCLDDRIRFPYLTGEEYFAINQSQSLEMVNVTCFRQTSKICRFLLLRCTRSQQENRPQKPERANLVPVSIWFESVGNTVPSNQMFEYVAMPEVVRSRVARRAVSDSPTSLCSMHSRVTTRSAPLSHPEIKPAVMHARMRTLMMALRIVESWNLPTEVPIQWPPGICKVNSGCRLD